MRPTRGSSAYVLVVAAIAAVGFIRESPWPILLAALLAVPASAATLPAYYLVFGLLALIPEVNPSSSSGSGTGSTNEAVTYSVTGAPAMWFTITTEVLGVLALAVAAMINVFLLRTWQVRRRARSGDVDPPPPPADRSAS